MPEKTKSNQTSEPNSPVDPNNNKISEEQKRKAIEQAPQKTDNTRKAGYDENGKLDNPKFKDDTGGGNNENDENENN